MHYAHSAPDAPPDQWETFQEHAEAVARLSRAFAEKFHAGPLGWQMGQLHDLGKLSQEFQAYLRGQRQRGPDHSTVGAREIIALAPPKEKPYARLAAYGIAGHHAGLPDALGDGGLEQRLARADLPALPVNWRNFVVPCDEALAPRAMTSHPDRSRRPFQIAFLGRMLFSALVDADRLATEAWCARLEQRQVDRNWPALPDIVGDLIARFDCYMAAKRAALSEQARLSPLNQLRQHILDHVRGQGVVPKGVFTLDVPTGGGKTLASLAFALEHARAHGMARIVYGIPFTAIIEQTAAILREALGDAPDADMQGRVVLEHHSALEAGAESDEGASPDAFSGKSRLRLAMENWAAPVIVTTNVQLFESLFSARPSRCRKLHNLCNAVIVLDEAQTIPLHLLRPCVAALDELVRNYGCSVVLCTATQPALLAPDFAGGFENVTGLAPDADALHAQLRRVTPRINGEMADDDLVREVAEQPQGLVIVNGRRHARELYLAAREAGLEGVIHLTTRQTAADRRAILADVRRRLRDGAPCRVIATSLIEAGVDVSFPRVWRAEAGLDSVVQAAGRCNREGGRPADESIVTIFRPRDRKPPAEIAQLATAFRRVAEKYGEDLFSRAAIELYFREVYWARGEDLDAARPPSDEQPIRLADAFRVSSSRADFRYRAYGEAFRFIRDGMAPVIIPFDEAPARALAQLRAGAPAGIIARRLQAWIVPVTPAYRKQLMGNGHVRFEEGFGEQFPVLVTPHLYTPECGLVWEAADNAGLADFII